MAEPVTLAFMYYRDFVDELEARGIGACRVQPLIAVERSENETLPYTYQWMIVLTAHVQAASEILAARLYVGSQFSFYANLDQYAGPENADLAQAAELVGNDLATLGIAARRGFYPHAEFGCGAAPDLWHFQEGRLVAGAAPGESAP